ncbi:MAG: hypothetical protein CVT67_01285 [Actinobacteria bacterium HGW-Actinobacteria-7]|nr:MAG: hypothetical protein CVT67_01285 [Actinobacteria bacterium HGW-Actinobacteria-7]
MLRELLAVPVVAVMLGVIVGAGLIAPLFWASRFATAEKADFALVATMVSSMGGLIVAGAILFGYRHLAADGFVWFGSSVVGGFVVGLGVAAVVMLRRLAKNSDETRS